MGQPRVLVVEDDVSLREALSDTLQLAGYAVTSVADGAAALHVLEQETIKVVVSDVQMGPMDGSGLLRSVKKQNAHLPVILMTAYGTIQKAVEAMHDGAIDYIVKPFEIDALANIIERYSAALLDKMSGLIAQDPRTRHLTELAKKVADTDVTVMISGESGTGKEIFARYIHNNSRRASGPFVAINCAAIPENMLEASLFGHEKGAFTGAYQASAGKFEQANGGTLLLDEISEMDLGLQAKLLRVLQEREVERLGGRKVIPLDVRVLATSNRIMRQEVDAGRFREDLYYRLHVFPINVPALKERKDDILPLSRFLLQRHAAGKETPQLTPEAEMVLMEHAWPGNIRELDNVMQRAMILKRGNKIFPEDLSIELACETKASAGSNAMELQDHANDLGDALKKKEQRLIIEALQSGNGNRKHAAMKLGISERTLRYKLARMREEGVNIPRGYGLGIG
ncbi:MAG: sigma-54 dependent transcriptional regulator [Gammaproteobacteria bacterium]